MLIRGLKANLINPRDKEHTRGDRFYQGVIVCLNPFCLYMSDRHPNYCEVLKNASWVLVDGKSLLVYRPILNTKFSAFPGPDFLSWCISADSYRSRKWFVLSNFPEEVRESLREKGVKVCGSELPPMLEFHRIKRYAEELKIPTEAKVILLGIGTPKQEILAHHLRIRYPESSILCIGAACNFLIKRELRAPKIMRVGGLEWVWRSIFSKSRVGSRLFGSVLAHFKILRNVVENRLLWDFE